jgi:hypothetical protein
MCGLAIDVPDMVSQPPSGTDERIEPQRERRRARRAEARERCAAGARVRDGGDGDRLLRCAGRGERAAAEVVVVVPGGDDGDDAGCRGRVERQGDEVTGGLHLRLADGEVDHVHAVLHGGLDRGDELGGVAVQPHGRSRNAEGLVVADVGAWGDARSGAATAHGRAGVPGGDARDVRAVP